ncbi:hypothetical protein ACH6CV_13175 [Bacillota bacterium Meth-B3]|nr:hypothetical protein [Christensenellaceae bacterium]MEA5065029.1 hypothetical protein [Eubacteriales bacterium]MEA5069859.1 hypothetical protein [Christensenellaceae bacterium]
MDDRELLGLTLGEALRRMADAGHDPTLAYTAAPRADGSGEARVVRVTGDALVAARFPGAADTAARPAKVDS